MIKIPIFSKKNQNQGVRKHWTIIQIGYFVTNGPRYAL